MPVVDYAQKAIQVETDGKLSDYTWRQSILTVLNTILPDETLTAEQKVKVYQISTKTYQLDEPDFTVDERAFILDRMSKVASPLVYGQALAYFEEKKDK